MHVELLGQFAERETLLERFQHHLGLEPGGEFSAVSSGTHGWKLVLAYFLSRFTRPSQYIRIQPQNSTNMKIGFISALALASTMCSCTVLNKVESAKTLDVYGPGVIQNPVLADLEVRDTKVTGTATGNSSAPGTVKNMALADAIKKANADVLVEPAFDMQSKGGKTTATVTGWPANYKNFRNVTQADLPVLEAGYMQKANVAVVNDAPAKKKGVGGMIFGVLVLVGLVVALTGSGG